MFDGFERFLYWMTSFGIGGDAEALCQLRAPIDSHTFVTESNSLLTMYRVVGSKRYIGSDEFDRQADALGTAIVGLLKAGQRGRQHSVLFGFRSNPSGGMDLLKKIMGPSLMTAKRFGADADFLFHDKIGSMAPHCVDEVAVFGIMTHTNGLSPDEKKRWDAAREKQFASLSKSGFIMDPVMSQTPMAPPSVMYSRHLASLQTLEEKMTNDGSGIKVMMDRMTCHETVAMMRQFLDAGATHADWKPHLLGDRPGMIDAKRSTKTLDIGLPMRIGRQVITEKLKESFGDAELVKRGKHFYGSVTLDVCPQQDPMPGFMELSRSIGNLVPYQVHFDVSPNGLSFNQMEKFFASIMGSAGEHNKAVKRGFDSLTAMQNAGEYITALRVIFTTWATNESTCVDNLSFLKSKVEGWGQATATNESGSPAHVYVASAPGFARTIPAGYLPTPMTALARMLPMFSPSSVWQTGQLVPITKEGRPYPISFGSSLQNYWGTLVFAPTGSGKSFLMNMLNAGVLFTPGASQLPMCAVIDKGPSAKGVVMLAKAILPPHLADQVAYWRPTPSDINYCVNPFDTQLGCDRPLESDKDFLVALLEGMAPNLGPESGKFIGRIIQVAFETYGRISPNAKKWQWNTKPELSEKLERVGIQFQEEKPPRVWDVVDAFFAKGMVDEAIEAQFYAVPLMSDLTRVLQDRRVLDVYGDAPTPTGEKIVKVFERNIIAAANEYKLFFSVTRHKAAARFTVIDIEGMASASLSEEGRRRFGLMMLFARRLGARNFFLHPDDIRDVCHPKYLAYQMERVQKIQEELKFLEYDEIHNAKGISAVQGLLQKDAREGRKYNVVGILSSQDLSDFPEDLVKNCYNFFILGAGSAAAGNELQATFELSDSERSTIMTECTRPGVMFGMFRTNRGMLSQLLYTKTGPRETWAYNTSATDMALRNELYDRIGVKKALGFLAKQFSTGSARPFIEEIRRTMGSEAASDDSMTSVILGKLQPKLDAYLATIPG